VLGDEPGFAHSVIQTPAFQTNGDRINAIYVTRNPDKLRAVL
jgi:hypothetical protein